VGDRVAHRPELPERVQLHVDDAEGTEGAPGEIPRTVERCRNQENDEHPERAQSYHKEGGNPGPEIGKLADHGVELRGWPGFVGRWYCACRPRSYGSVHGRGVRRDSAPGTFNRSNQNAHAYCRSHLEGWAQGWIGKLQWREWRYQG